MKNKVVREYYREYLQKVSKDSIEKYKEIQKNKKIHDEKTIKNESNKK